MLSTLLLSLLMSQAAVRRTTPLSDDPGIVTRQAGTGNVIVNTADGGPFGVFVAKQADGGDTPVVVTNTTSYDQIGSFGEYLTVPNIPVVNLSWPYNTVLPETTWTNTTGSGSAGCDAGHMVLSVSDAGSVAQMRSVDTERYVSGQGMSMRFSFVSSGCAPGQQQLIGAGGLGLLSSDGGRGDGYFFGCCPSCETDGGYTFGVMRRNSLAGGTDYWVPASQWNGGWHDLDGGTYPDITKGRTYQILWQGSYGLVTWAVEDAPSGKLAPVHFLQYAGTSTDQTTQNPSLPVSMEVRNLSSNAVNTMRTPAMSILQQGDSIHTGLRRAISASISTSTTEQRVLGLSVGTSLNGQTNRAKIRLEHLSWNIGGASGTDVIIRLRWGDGPSAAIGVTGQVFTPINSLASIVSVDTTGTYAPDGGFYSAGIDWMEFVASGNTASNADLSNFNMHVMPGNVLYVTAQSSSGTPPARIAVSWIEER